MQLCSSELLVTSVETAEQQLDDLQNLTETIGKLTIIVFTLCDKYFIELIYKCNFKLLIFH